MKALIRRLNALPGRLMNRALDAAAAAAENAAAVARSTVPVDTGALRDSIATGTIPGGAVLRAGTDHAAMVEYGTTRMPPRPYMLPAARAVQAEFFREAGEGIKHDYD